MSSRNRRIGFLVTTALVAVPMALAGLGYLSRADEIVQNFANLGYPLYFATVLGIWKLLGAAALLIRVMPKATEWAYAGFTFVLTGAAVSHVAAGDPFSSAVPPLVMLALLATSYRLQPKA